MAQASLAELDMQLEILQRLNYLSDETLSQLVERMTSLGKQQYALRNALLRNSIGKFSGPAIANLTTIEPALDPYSLTPKLPCLSTLNP